LAQTAIKLNEKRNYSQLLTHVITVTYVSLVTTNKCVHYTLAITSVCTIRRRLLVSAYGPEADPDISHS